MTELQIFSLLALGISLLALSLWNLRAQKQIEKRLSCLEEKPGKMDLGGGELPYIQNLQNQVEKTKEAILDAFKSLVDLVEIHTAKSTQEIVKELQSLPSQGSLLKSQTEFQKKSREIQEEISEKTLQNQTAQWNSFYKKFHQTLRESGVSMLEYWEQEKTERKQQMDALLVSWKNIEIELAEYKTKENGVSPETFGLLEKRLTSILDALKPIMKEVLSWQKEPLARRKDLESRKFTLVLEEKLPPVVVPPLPDQAPRLTRESSLVESDAASKEAAPLHKSTPAPKTADAEKISTLLTEIHKHRMQFLGASLQEEVLQAVHSFFLREKSCLQSILIQKLMEEDLLPILQKGTLTKTKTTSIINILRKGKCFDLFRGEDEAIHIGLSEKVQDYPAFRKAHDRVFITLAQEIGITLSPREWALFLYETEDKVFLVNGLCAKEEV